MFRLNLFGDKLRIYVWGRNYVWGQIVYLFDLDKMHTTHTV